MRRIYLLWGMAGIMLFNIGCGRKDVPLVPPIPKPLPAQNASAQIEDHAILLSWTLPSEYDTGKPLEINDIKTITVFRKTEPAQSHAWEFTQNSEGWAEAGKTLPIKWHKGVLRTGAQQENAFIVSPDNLSIPAETTRYIRLRLWSKNYDRGYITFTTNDNTKWDTNIDLEFQPAVYTSFYTYQNVFSVSKLKAFHIVSEENGENAERARKYVIDMQRVPSWKGTIKQIGIILHNTDPNNAVAEIGVDRVELTNTLEEQTTIYESSPWVFFDDEEGWRTSRPGTLLGAAGGVLYAQGVESILLLSSPGQNIPLKKLRQVQIRMKVTAGENAYLVLRTPQGDLLSPPPDMPVNPPPAVLPIPLKGNSGFYTYTLPLREILADQLSAERPSKDTVLSQIGLFFPALNPSEPRQILIDYVQLAESTTEASLLLPLLIQKQLPPIEEIAQQIRQQISVRDPEFETPYEALPAMREQAYAKPLKLVEISPRNPAPVSIEEGEFLLKDTGEFAVDDVQDPTLIPGERYTYTIELTDRKKRKNVQATTVTVDFSRIPAAPHNLRAESGDGEIRLTWNRPFLSLDGKKIRSFLGYTIFRAEEPGRYPSTPLHKASPAETTFLDRTVVNGVTYYYTIQSIGTAPAALQGRTVSAEVSATPTNTTPPDVPTGLVGIYTEPTATLFWNAVQANDFAGFNLYRSETPSGEFRRINAQPISQASYQDATVKVNAVYYYYVTSYDTATPPNESEPSNVIVVETAALE